jgi:energy-converting hydrogenase Eha subunit A
VITTLSTVLPTIGPLIGLDITPEVVRQLGDQAILAVQAVGGLAGTILTVYGRVRATTTLERRQLKLTM